MKKRKIIRRVFFAVLLVFLGVKGYQSVSPHILSIPVVKPGEALLTITGTGFGEKGYVVFHSPGKPAEEALATIWSDQRISVPLPQDSGKDLLVQVARRLGEYAWRSNAAPVVFQAEGLPSQPYHYETPVAPDAPWPSFRRDHRNSGRSPLPAHYYGDEAWAFHTEKGIFSTPVIDSENTIYVGSADQNFYAIRPDGTMKWKLRTEGIIDSAAVLHRADESGQNALTFISGDGKMYHLSIGGASPQILWKFDAATEPGAGYINWWEGNVAIGYDGTLYAGNTNWNYYAIRPDGSVKWKYPTKSNNWSNAAFGPDGTIYWAALDTKVRAVAANGLETWSKGTWGMVAASVAVGSDGTLYIGSFDSYFYAIDPLTGDTKWTFKTGDHIYSSAALGCDRNGNTNAIYFGSTDGIFYALDTQGRLRWAYDTGDPIRSSPALGGPAPGEFTEIVYFGSGNGRLYALNAHNGARRWSYDTTPEGGEWRDRNDLNGSPALGKTGIYIGGEHGDLCYIPYDYPLYIGGKRTLRQPTEDLPDNGVALMYVTPGGTTEHQPPASIEPSSTLTFRLVVREAGKTIDARMKTDALHVTLIPDTAHALETSADGHYIHLRPNGFWKPGATLQVNISGTIFQGGIHLGNLTLAPWPAGSFAKSFSFAITAPQLPALPLAIEQDRVSALEWTRLAVSLPTMMPSLNQIGFDYFDCLVSAIDITEPSAQGEDKVVLWMMSGVRGEDGLLRAAAKPDFMMPLNGVYQGNQFILRNENFRLSVFELPIPFQTFELRGALGQDLVVKTGATAYAEADAFSIPDYGPLLVLSGLANDVYKKLVVQGTYVTRPYDDRGKANQRPEGVEVEAVDFTPPSKERDGVVEAKLRLAQGVSCAVEEHRPAILLLDTERHEAVVMDYLNNVEVRSDGRGNVAGVMLHLPKQMALPEQTAAVVILDAFPMLRKPLF